MSKASERISKKATDSNIKEVLIAHVRQNEDGTWSVHPLADHLSGVANYAGTFSAKFKSAEWGKALGFSHDAGKSRARWQQYLKGKSGFDPEAHLEWKSGKIPHAIYGAKVAENVFGKVIGRILAYGIAGHHAGLPDWSPAEGAGQSSLQFQAFQIKSSEIAEIDPYIEQNLRNLKIVAPPWKFADDMDCSLWIRMLFSCLVDADFLDTEKFMNVGQFNLRGDYLSMQSLWEKCSLFFNRMDAQSENTEVNAIRRKVRKRCLEAADAPQGIFSLSVPTGGGKTLSSLAFGIQHAIKHQLDRIIYVIPYTSIIEQNADVFRSVVGDDQIIEHHSSLEEDDATPKSRLAAENWDAPLIVTTSVQFFESLFSAKSSRCRKLHNIANSVVILDEAQMLPVDFLEPILEVMRLLVAHYKTTFVISTATQPALGEKKFQGYHFKGIKDIREIMGNKDEVTQLYDSLKRVQVQMPETVCTVSDWNDIARKLCKHEQVLCIVSDRKSCRELFERMPEGTVHLSALMCGQHRSEVIAKIKEKLKQNQQSDRKEPVRIVSTQLVEAGVDIDFPVVYRALAGLDSIAQAAGRCNREGKMSEPGTVIVFNPPRQPRIGLLRKAAETTRSLYSVIKEDPLAYGVFEKYFSELYWKANSLDAKQISGKLTSRACEFYFRTAAERFRIIDDESQRSVLVRYGEGDKLIDQLKSIGPNRSLMRKLQRYSVNIYDYDFKKMLQQGKIEEIHPRIYALASGLDYSPHTGLNCDEVRFDPEGYIV